MSTVKISGQHIQNTSGEYIRSTTGGLVDWRQYRNANESSLPSRSDHRMWTQSHTKLGGFDETYLLITAKINTQGDSSGDCGTYVEVNGKRSGAYCYTYSAYSQTLNYIGGNDIFFAPAGTLTINIGWTTANGSAGDRPGQYFNNGGGRLDARVRPHGSVIWVREFTMDAHALTLLTGAHNN